MQARDELFAAYAEWRRWTQIEGQAIEAANWPRMRECQEAKQRLQPRIICGNDQARRECDRLGLNRGEMERDMRKVIDELIALETRNGQTLAHKRRQTDAEQLDLDRAQRNLRRIHHSYGGCRAPAWSSFS
jgi:hypothetical protein